MTGKHLAFALAGATVFMFGCGPTYPNCDNDENCAARNEACVNGTCSQCRDDSKCMASNACGVCEGARCSKRPNCCTSDLDCPNGGRCWNVPGQNYGECGAQCDATHPCPPGQRCNNGICEPDYECTTDADCTGGKKCIDHRCTTQCAMETIYFDFNESRLRADAQKTLNANADCIKGKGGSVRIEGHCDERGTEEYNMALGERRAVSAKRYLVNLGVSNGSLSVVSYGKERPVCTESNEECWAKNRRAEFH